MNEPGDQETKIQRPRNLAKRTHEMLVGLSERDPLTGVGNVRAMDKWFSNDEKLRADVGVKDENRRKTVAQPILRGTIVFWDVDGLNDANKISHEYGDLLVKTIFGAAQGVAQRAGDEIFRRGDRSDEGLIVLPGVSIDDWETIEQKFQDAIQARSSGHAFNASMVFGEYGVHTTARESYKRLDEILSRAKAAAGKGVHVNTIFDKSNG